MTDKDKFPERVYLEKKSELYFEDFKIRTVRLHDKSDVEYIRADKVAEMLQLKYNEGWHNGTKEIGRF